MMTLHTLLDRIKLMLGVTDRDELLTEIIRLTAMPVISYIKQDTLPNELEWIVVELAVARYNRLGAEGYTEEKNDNIQNRYEENTLEKYIPFLDTWIENHTEAIDNTPKVRFF